MSQVGALGAVLALAWAATAWAMPIDEVPNPRHRGVWVSDTIDVIEPATEQRMNALIDAAAKALDVEIAVVTVESVTAQTPKDYATDLFAFWGVGKAGKDTGLLILFSRGDRAIEMETGYGLEAALTDGWLWNMQGEVMLPPFKEGRYGDGLLAGLEATLAQLEARRADIGTAPPAAGSGSSHEAPDDDPPIDPWLFWLSLFGLGAGGTAAVRWKRRRERLCASCHQKMAMIPDAEDDAELEPGQVAEERVRSVDYEIWCCDQCDTRKVIRVNKWFSERSKCPACGYKTRRVWSRPIRAATYTSTGLEEVVETCAHCPHERRRTRTTPRLRPPSSSSSSSSSSGYRSGGSGSGGSSSSSGSRGSSFGGGRSGGGGAGRRF